MVSDNQEQIFYPVCIVPPEKHYDSFHKLVEDIRRFEESRAYICQDNPEILRSDKSLLFEQVLNSSHTAYKLLPYNLDYGILYRGQSQYFPRCLPTLFRGEMSETEHFIEQIKLMEFEQFLQRMPLTRKFVSMGWFVDTVGLAQHYGFKTNVLDFTSDIMVAMFFAMCDLGEDGNYHAKTEDKEYVGYVYAMPTCEHKTVENQYPFQVFSDRINVIGLQPFTRPGHQKGFSFAFKSKEDDFESYLYSFSYTKEDSEEVFSYFDNGKSLWVKDEIADIANAINSTKSFSYTAVSRAKKNFSSSKSIKRWITELEIHGYKVTSPNKLRWYQKEEPVSEDEWMKIRKSISHRQILVEDKVYPYRNVKELGIEIYTNLLYGCVDAPQTYDSGVEFMIGYQGVVPYYGLRWNTARKHLEPYTIDHKIHAQWESLNPNPPITRSFNLPDTFKMVVRKQR